MFLGCWLAGGIALVAFYLVFVFFFAAPVHQLMLVLYLQALWLHCIFLGIVTAAVLLGSIVFAAPSWCRRRRSCSSSSAR
jgi:hypothetical protein